MSGRTVDPRRIEVVDAEVARILRGMSGMDRLRLAHEAWDLARQRLTVFVSARHPEWSPDEVGKEVAKRLARRREPILPGRDAYFARPEDIILNKLLYFQQGGSERHLRDIAGMLRVSGAEIDAGYIDDWAQRLGVADTWRAVRER